MGAAYANAFGINDAGQIAGIRGDGRGFLYDNGNVTVIPTLGGTESGGFAINAAGSVVGYANLVGAQHAMLFDTQGIHDLGTLGGTNSSAHAINDAGMIAGSSFQTGNGYYQAFLYDSVTGMRPLEILPSFTSSSAWGINNQGDVVGALVRSNGERHAFLYHNGTVTDWGGLPGDLEAVALDINNLGQAVGHSGPIGIEDKAVYYDDSGVYDLNTLIPADSGWMLRRAHAINDRGQIVGFGFFSNPFLEEAFLLTPITVAVPEPGSLALLVTLGSGVLWLRRRRSHSYVPRR